MLAGLFIGLVGLVTLLWLWLNLSPARQGNMKHTLSPADVSDHPLVGGVTASAPTSNQASNQSSAYPRIVMVCPGRNEADMLPTTLPQLCAQDYPDYGVIFIDDDSDDDTPRITADCAGRYPHLTVVRNGTPPPEGWVGKCWAVQCGIEVLRERERELSDAKKAQWLCFTDADIFWDPRCLSSAMAFAQRTDADVVALLPNMIFGSVAERLGVSTMVLALGILFPFDAAMDPKNPNTLTGGAFILVRRSLYDQIGGHESVRRCVVEDINLGKNLKAAGGRVRIALTPQLLRCRMYEGWSDMWEGLTKNAYAGLEYKWYLAAGFVVTSLLANVLPPAYAVGGAVWFCMGGGVKALAVTALAVMCIALQARAMNMIRRFFGLRWYYALATPPGSLLYLAFLLGSVWRYYRGGNVWKGRQYGQAFSQSDDVPVDGDKNG